jgi:phosphotransferase system  glucose/maltose/N-acetylglucosamine-specific IIC component
MTLADRLRPLVPMLVMTGLILVVSAIGFDLLGGRPMFWTSDELTRSFLFRCLIGGPFILFALLVAQQRAQGGK